MNGTLRWVALGCLLAVAAGTQACGDSAASAPQPLVGPTEQDAASDAGGKDGTSPRPDGEAKEGGPPPPDGSVDADPDVVTNDTRAVLEIYAMDLWAQFFPASEATLTVTRAGAPVEQSGFPVIIVPLKVAGSYQIKLSAPEYRDLNLTLDYDGTSSLSSAVVQAGADSAGQGISLSHEMRPFGIHELPVHTTYLGLRHKWFSAEGRPPRRGNNIEFLADGEQAWASVSEDLRKATDSVLISTWWWQSDFELVRPKATHATMTESERWPNTILGIIEGLPASKRILVGQFWGQDSILSWMTADTKLKSFAETPNDNFEFMGMANETTGTFSFAVDPFVFGDRVRADHPETAGRSFGDEQPIESTVPAHNVDLSQWPIGVTIEAASYHQKFMVIDHQLAFVGGMNLKEVDFDSSAHDVFDVRRMKFASSQSDRQAVLDKTKLPDNGPRKDYMVRILGPSAQDVADIFHERWMHQISQGVDYAANSTPFEVQRAVGEQPGGKQLQVTATLPQPFWEHALAETWFNAVSQASQYIYIEDQYFRAPMINDAIAARMKEVPGLLLIVITKPINEWTDPGCAWTYKSHELFKSNFPDRYTLMQLRSFDTVVTWGVDETESRYMDMDVHSKMLIVDDKFMSVGSANKNNRGMVYEGELNVAVVDLEWVRAARRRIIENLLPTGSTPTDDVLVWLQQLKDAAAWNDAVYATWETDNWDVNLNGAPLPAAYTPKGFVHGMDFPLASACAIESVGPDMTLVP